VARAIAFYGTTVLADVTSSFGTFRAGVDTRSGRHRGEMRTNITVEGENVVLVTRPHDRLFQPRARFVEVGADGVEVPVTLDADLFHVGYAEADGESSVVHLSVHPSGGIEGVLLRADGSKHVLSALARYEAVDAPDHHDTAVYRDSDLTAAALAGFEHAMRGSCTATAAARSSSPHYNSTARQAHESEHRARHAAWVTEGRRRRSEPQHCSDSSGMQCSCAVGLVGDLEFYVGPNAQRNVAYGIQYMVNVLLAADQIYRATDFDGMTGLGFVVHSAIIYTSRSGSPVPLQYYESGNTFLNALTSGLNQRYRDACHVMLFTHRDFQQGLLGMAWVADATGYGGICDPLYNVGFNTGVNFGRTTTPFVASLVFAHEIGHNWGAEHDPDDSNCAPGDSDGGNYIMFAAASDGSHQNNRLFSPCSRAQIGSVISYLREGCFVEAGTGCGDGILSGEEECDCGDDCTPTSCCTSECTVNRAMYECSPQNPIRFPCCTLQCMYKSRGEVCHEADECASTSYCNGTSSSCPVRSPVSDNTPCHCYGGDCESNPNTHPQVCRAGVCHTFVCELYGGEQCGLPHPNSCTLGCRGPGWGNGEECVSTFDVSKPPANFSEGRLLTPGTPCRMNLGRCDEMGSCVTVATDDGLDAETNGQTAETFFNRHWQGIIGGCAGATIVVLAALHYREHILIKRKWRESERAYLLEAANAHTEHQEDMIFMGLDVVDDPDDENHADDYACPDD